jgi:trimethylamine--corrinoid protein Co-methyltransferase
VIETLEPTPQRPAYRRLADEQAERIHTASLEILERTGVRFYNDEAVDLFRSAGAAIEDGGRVRIPPERVEWALRATPKKLTLFDQRGAPTLNLSGRQAYYGNGSDLLYIIDHRNGRRRRAVYQDVMEGVRLLDKLSEIDFVMSFFHPEDMPAGEAETLQMRAMLDYSDKPIIYVTTNLARTVDVVHMCESGVGEAAFRDHPFAACYINIATPLRHNRESVEKLLWLAERGLPMIYRPAIFTRGVTTPITVAGFIALNNAAQLAGAVLAQLKREGTPIIRCSHGGATFDMKIMMGQLAAPEAQGFNADLAHWYGQPCFGNGGMSGSSHVDQQAAAEAALTLMSSTLSGAQLIHDVGYLENGLTGSFEQLLICHEMISWLRRFMVGLRVDSETLALDVIDEVGPDGQFLEMEHTATHCHEDWYPELFSRGGGTDPDDEHHSLLRERIRAKIAALLGTDRSAAVTERAGFGQRET